MRENVKRLCDLFVENKKSICKEFKWEFQYMLYAAAAQFACMDKEADIAALKNAERLIKEQTGIFSEFRNFVKLPVMVYMTQMEDMESYFNNLQKVYQSVNKGICGSNYKILAATALINGANEIKYDEYVDKMDKIYKEMKNKHFFLTCEEDIPAAALLALSNKSVEAIIEDMETCFDILRKQFHSSDRNQAICEVLALSEKNPADKCAKVIEIYKALKEKKCTFSSTNSQYALIGCLALLDVDAKTLCNEICEANAYIKQFKGFGDLSMGASTRRMCAAMFVLTASAKNDEDVMDSSITQNILNSVSIEVAIMACVTVLICASSCSAAAAAAAH